MDLNNYVSIHTVLITIGNIKIQILYNVSFKNLLV